MSPPAQGPSLDERLLTRTLALHLDDRSAADLAADLITRYDTLGAVFARTRSLDLPAEIQATFGLMAATAQQLSRARLRKRPVIGNWQALIDYCRTSLAHESREHLTALFLDRKNHLIADETLASGTVDHVPVYPREILRRAIALDATALILVHNHPSGDPTPSQSDIDMTRRVAAALAAIDVTLHDHLIVGAEAEVSLRSEGLI